MNPLLYLAAFLFLANLYVTLDILLGARRMRNLADIQPLQESAQPLVSIIVPACNEEETIEPALQSLLGLDYANLEIIVINDRSTDRTGEVLKNFQRKHPQLKVLEIEKLPEGWLGKNHAMYQGAQTAQGEYLLFTDADILFEATTIARAMNLLVGENIDHLSLIFKNIAKGWLLNAMMVDVGAGLFFLFKPWKVSDPKSRHFIGAGAFNLVRRSVYMAIDGHNIIRMHPIDDVMLGKMIKRNGFRQECLSGYDFLQVHWYATPGKMVQGLMKNIFALYNYRVSWALGAVMVIIVGTILPFWGTIFSGGAAQLFFGLTILVRLASATLGCLHTGTTLWAVPFSFITPYVNIYIILKGMLTNIADNGITWRGTYYNLDELRKNDPIL